MEEAIEIFEDITNAIGLLTKIHNAMVLLDANLSTPVDKHESSDVKHFQSGTVSTICYASALFGILVYILYIYVR